MPFQLSRSISKIAHLGPDSYVTSIISAGTALCLDLHLLPKTNVCYKNDVNMRVSQHLNPRKQAVLQNAFKQSF